MKQENKDQQNLFIKTLAAGYISGVANILSGQPFDICKVRVQRSDQGNLVSQFKSIVKNEGVLTLWSGSLFPLVGFGACSSILFSSNEFMKGFFIKRNQSNKLALKDYMLSGAFAGYINSFIASPVEHIRIWLQTQRSQYKGNVDCFKQIYHQKGLRGIYKGFGITLVRESFLYAAYFATYEKLKSQIENPQKIHLLFCGGMAGISGWIFSYAFDNIKTQIQTQSLTGQNHKGAIQIFREQGLRRLHKGFSIAMIRAFPINAISFLSYEYALKKLNEKY